MKGMKGRTTMQMDHSHYRHLGIMLALSFVSMFALMYAMVDAFPNVYVNVNQLYMAGLMTAPMALIELVVMRAMFHDKRANMAVVGLALMVLVGCWTLIRQQTAVTDSQFLRSMIPHHAGALLMCKEAPVTDTAIRDLCRAIVQGQEAEITQMKAILERLGQ